MFHQARTSAYRWIELDLQVAPTFFELRITTQLSQLSSVANPPEVRSCTGDISCPDEPEAPALVPPLGPRWRSPWHIGLRTANHGFGFEQVSRASPRLPAAADGIFGRYCCANPKLASTKHLQACIVVNQHGMIVSEMHAEKQAIAYCSWSLFREAFVAGSHSSIAI